METEDAECELCPGTAPCLCDVGALPPAPALSTSPTLCPRPSKSPTHRPALMVVVSGDGIKGIFSFYFTFCCTVQLSILPMC